MHDTTQHEHEHATQPRYRSPYADSLYTAYIQADQQHERAMRRAMRLQTALTCAGVLAFPLAIAIPALLDFIGL
jgi:hypothetical protein